MLPLSRVFLCVIIGNAFISAQSEKIREVFAPENEVLKPDSEGNSFLDVVPEMIPEGVSPDRLEAFYYPMYGDYTARSMEEYKRPGNITSTSSCSKVRDVPRYLRRVRHMRPAGLSEFYKKYTEAYNIPVVGSASVSDRALQRACYVLRFLLADRRDLRWAFYKSYGRITIVAANEDLLKVPELSFLPEVFDMATPGLGAIPIAPVSIAGEENVRCYRNDTYRREDILLREIAQGIYHLAAKRIMPGFDDNLRELYESAMASGWWQNTYAATTRDAYFGEGVQSYFSVNAYSTEPDGNHNRVNTRTKLSGYDPGLYMFIMNLFPCGNSYMKRCQSRGNEAYQRLEMDCF